MSQNSNTQLDYNSFFIVGGKHDKDRFELQLGFDGLGTEELNKFSYDVCFMMFTPKIMGMNSLSQLEEFQQDIKSYLRLHSNTADPKKELDFDRAQELLSSLKSEKTWESLRLFGVECLALLKTQYRRGKRTIWQNEFSIEILKKIVHDFELSQRILTEFRTYLKERNLHRKELKEFSVGSLNYELIMLNEILSHQFRQSLGKLVQFLKKNENYTQVRSDIKKLLDDEIESLSSFPTEAEKILENTPSEDDDLDEQSRYESYVYRMSLLKKYFQKPLFLQTKKHNLEGRLLIPVYAIAAVLAATWAVIIQYIYFKSFGSVEQIAAFALIGISAYVVKDLMKYFVRKSFMAKGSEWMPQKKYDLLFHSRRKNIRKIGQITEYFKSFHSSDISDELKSIRYTNNFNRYVEENLDEDIIQIKKTVKTNSLLKKIFKGQPWGIREIIRIRFDRYLGFLDDPIKTIHSLTKDLKIQKIEVHRQYEVHIMTWIHPSNISKEEIKNQTKFRGFKIKIDKNGVVGSETLSWDKDAPPPLYPV